MEEQSTEELLAQMRELLSSDGMKALGKKQMGAKRFGDLMNLSLGVSDIVTSGKQKREGERLRAQLKEPDIYTPTRGDQNLQGALANAQNDIYDTQVQLAPTELANMQSYFTDMQNAQSTGQASNYGALAQAASLNQGRRNLELGAMNDALIDKNKARYDSLLGTELQNNASYENRAQEASSIALDKYYREATEASALESQGRENMRNSLYNTGEFVTDVIGRGDYNGSNVGEDIKKFGGFLKKNSMNLIGRSNRISDLDRERIFRQESQFAPPSGYSTYDPTKPFV